MLKFLQHLLTPSYDQLVNRAHKELHLFHLLKYKNFTAALVHRKRSDELFAAAKLIKEKK